MLYRDGLRLALEAADTVVGPGQLSHLGVFADEEELGDCGRGPCLPDARS